MSASDIESAGAGTAAGFQRTQLRTLTAGKTTSNSSRSSEAVGGRITSACRVDSVR